MKTRYQARHSRSTRSISWWWSVPAILLVVVLSTFVVLFDDARSFLPFPENSVSTPGLRQTEAFETVTAGMGGGAPWTPTDTPISTDTPTPDLEGTLTAKNNLVATAVAATLTAQPTSTDTPTPTPDLEGTLTAKNNLVATAVAATLTAQPTSTDTPTPTDTPMPTPNLEGTLTAKNNLVATAIAATLTAQPIAAPLPPAVSVPQSSGLALELLNASRMASVPANYPNETAQFINVITSKIGEFQLPTLGITSGSMTSALRRSDVGNRINGLINEIWGSWLGDARSMGLDVYSSDPSVVSSLSPFRRLVIRMIQGRQGPLVDNQQHGLWNYFSRNEESHVWSSNMDGVIGAVNRESFLWP